MKNLKKASLVLMLAATVTGQTLPYWGAVRAAAQHVVNSGVPAMAAPFAAAYVAIQSALFAKNYTSAVAQVAQAPAAEAVASAIAQVAQAPAAEAVASTVAQTAQAAAPVTANLAFEMSTRNPGSISFVEGGLPLTMLERAVKFAKPVTDVVRTHGVSFMADPKAYVSQHAVGILGSAVVLVATSMLTHAVYQAYKAPAVTSSTADATSSTTFPKGVFYPCLPLTPDVEQCH